MRVVIEPFWGRICDSQWCISTLSDAECKIPNNIRRIGHFTLNKRDNAIFAGAQPFLLTFMNCGSGWLLKL